MEWKRISLSELQGSLLRRTNLLCKFAMLIHFLVEDPRSRVIYSPICSAFHALAKKTIPQAAVNVTFTPAAAAKVIDYGGIVNRSSTFGLCKEGVKVCHTWQMKWINNDWKDKNQA